MSGSIKLKHASGNGVSITAPSSNPAADRTLELPSDADGIIAKTDSSGNLGVGVTSPTHKLEVVDSSFSPIYTRGSGNVGGIRFGNSSHTNGFIYYDNGPNMNFQIGGAEKLRIQSGGGISFNGDLAAANALDDYEEGTWTPSLGFGLSFTSASGSYSKIGDIVHAFCVLNHPNTSNANYVIVGGLPFTANSNNNCGGGFLRYSNYNGAEKLMFHVNNNNTSFVPYLSTGGGTITNATLSDKQVQVVLTYKTN